MPTIEGKPSTFEDVDNTPIRKLRDFREVTPIKEEPMEMPIEEKIEKVKRIVKKKGILKRLKRIARKKRSRARKFKKPGKTTVTFRETKRLNILSKSEISPSLFIKKRK